MSFLRGLRDRIMSLWTRCCGIASENGKDVASEISADGQNLEMAPAGLGPTPPPTYGASEATYFLDSTRQKFTEVLAEAKNKMSPETYRTACTQLPEVLAEVLAEIAVAESSNNHETAQVPNGRDDETDE